MTEVLAVVSVGSSVLGFVQKRKEQKQKKKAAAIQAEQFRVQQEANQKIVDEQRKGQELAQERAEEVNNAQRLSEIRQRRVKAAAIFNQYGISAGLSSSGQAAGSSIAAGLVGNLARADTLSTLDAGIATANLNANQIAATAKADVGNLQVGVNSANVKAGAAASNAEFLTNLGNATRPSVSQFEELFSSGTKGVTGSSGGSQPIAVSGKGVM